MFEMSAIATATSPAKLAKYSTHHTVQIIISDNTTFIYYSNIKLAGILHFDMFISYKT